MIYRIYVLLYCVWPMRRNYLQISKRKKQYWVTDLNIVWRACAVPEIIMILGVSCGPLSFCHWIISSPLSRVKNSMKQNNCLSVEKETPLNVTFSVKIGRKMVYFHLIEIQFISMRLAFVFKWIFYWNKLYQEKRKKNKRFIIMILCAAWKFISMTVIHLFVVIFLFYFHHRFEL